MFGKIKKYFFDKDYILQNLVVITGQKCSLRCKNCANFSPFHSKELDFYDINKIISDIDKISKRIKSFKHIQIQGGDCFLHKDIYVTKRASLSVADRQSVRNIRFLDNRKQSLT